MALTKVSTDGVKDDAITSGKIPANAVGASELANNAVTTNKLEQLSQNRILGAGSSGGNVSELTASQVRTIINVEDGATASSGTTINNNADNRVITGSGTANTLNGESNVNIDSSGRVLIGTTSTDDYDGFNSSLQVTGANGDTSSVTISRFSNNGSGANLVIGKSRTGTIGNDAVLQAGDNIGSIQFHGNDGSGFHDAAQIKVNVASGVGNDDMPADLIFSTNGGTTGVTERMAIASNGKVSVKTNGLNLENATATSSRAFSITNASGTTGWTFGNGVLGSSHQFVIYDNTAGAGRMLIDGNGIARFNNGIQLGNGLTNSTAHQLDDYEEGTWTPDLRFGGGNSGVTYGSRTGKYIKIGGIVIARFGIKLNNKGSSTGSARIYGLPFSGVHSSYYHDAGTTIMTEGGTESSGGHASVFVTDSTRLAIRQGAYCNQNYDSTHTAFTNATGFFGTVVYSTIA